MLPEKTWKSESVLRLGVGIFGTLCIGVFLSAAITKFNPGWSEEEVRFLSMVVVTLALHGAAIFWIKWFLTSENLSWTDAFGFNLPNRGRAVGLGIVSAILVLPVAWGLQQLTALVMNWINIVPKAQPVVQELQKSGDSPFQQIYFALIALIAAPIVEEMLFRGILYPTIKKAGYPKLALWVTSILFGLIHYNAPAFLALVFFAMILTLLYEETGNLLAPIIAHGCFNTANFVLLLFAKNFTQFEL